MTRGQSLFTFEFFPDDIVELTAERIFANGIRYHTPYDALNDMRNMEVPVRAAKKVGLYTAGGVVYTVSPVHTDDYYARKTRELIKLGVDAVYLKDPSGLLTPERAQTLVPAIKAVCGALPLHLHSHCLTGLAPLHGLPRCRAWRRRGAHRDLDTGQWRVASGDRKLRARMQDALGFDVPLDLAPVGEVAERLRYIAGARRQADRQDRRIRRLPLRAPDARRHGVQPEIAACSRSASRTGCPTCSKKRRGCGTISATRSSSARSHNSS